jgi:hypothetical protein
MSKKKQDEWWDSYAEMRKVAKIIRDVLGWESFTSWESYQRKYGAQEWKLGAGKPFTTPTPVAFYDGEWRVFSPDHEQLDVFDPLHNMSDAWKVLQAMMKYHGTTIPSKREGVIFDRFCELLLGDETSFGTRELFPATLVVAHAAKWTPARICDAALQAIEPEKQRETSPVDQEATEAFIDGLKKVQRLAEVIEEQRDNDVHRHDL